jgi:hypothetical protein
MCPEFAAVAKHADAWEARGAKVLALVQWCSDVDPLFRDTMFSNYEKVRRQTWAGDSRKQWLHLLVRAALRSQNSGSLASFVKGDPLDLMGFSEEFSRQLEQQRPESRLWIEETLRALFGIHHPPIGLAHFCKLVIPLMTFQFAWQEWTNRSLPFSDGEWAADLLAHDCQRRYPAATSRYATQLPDDSDDDFHVVGFGPCLDF